MNKKEAQELLRNSYKYNSDPESVLKQAEAVYIQATQGFTVEVAGRDMEGNAIAVECIQKAPAVAVQSLQVKMSVFKTLMEIANKKEEEETKIELTVNVGNLEDNL